MSRNPIVIGSARSAQARHEAADEPEHERVDQALHEQRRCHRERERDLAERRQFIVDARMPLKPTVGDHSADRAADEPEDSASTITDVTTGNAPKPIARSVAISFARLERPSTWC